MHGNRLVRYFHRRYEVCRKRAVIRNSKAGFPFELAPTKRYPLNRQGTRIAKVMKDP
ncbi:MAG TPA: hypothetical protein VL087_07405 [Nitrospirota bacterium]|nr:hypothetical protein [Nitrospirota bacterium]